MTTDQEFDRSARNLFETCAGCTPGDRVLLVHETETDAYYDPALALDLKRAAEGLGLRVTLHGVPLSRTVRDPGADLLAKMAEADCTVFLARLGDQIRYRTRGACRSQIVCYALDRTMFASSFGGSPYGAFDRLRTLIDTAVAQARQIDVTCPLGTHFRGTMPQFDPEAADTTRKRFPVSIAAPIPARTFQGQIVQSGFLTGTGSNYYMPYACALQHELTVKFEGNRITQFNGNADDVAVAMAHYAKVGETYGIDPHYVHSWHAGIHPGLSYDQFAGQSTERWSGGAFGNPRILHLHTCGTYPPGEISLNVIDPTVRLDGIALWEAGRLHPERIPGGAALLAEHPEVAALFAAPAQDVGLALDGRLRLLQPAPMPQSAPILETA
jgi:hypothetical protein